MSDIVDRLLDIASGPACMNPENIDAVNTISEGAAEIERLRQDIEGSRQLAKTWQQKAEEAWALLREARNAAKWLLIRRPTPNTPDMMGVYERWPWINEV